LAQSERAKILSAPDFLDALGLKYDIHAASPEKARAAIQARMEKEGAADSFFEKHYKYEKLQDPSWAKQYGNWKQYHYDQIIDDFFKSMPDKQDSLNNPIGPITAYSTENEGRSPWADIYENILNQADVKALTIQLIKCYYDPDFFIELLCQQILNKDKWFDKIIDGMKESGLLDALKYTSESANSLIDGIEAGKALKASDAAKSNAEKGRYQEELAIVESALVSLIDQSNILKKGADSECTSAECIYIEEEIKLNKQRVWALKQRLDIVEGNRMMTSVASASPAAALPTPSEDVRAAAAGLTNLLAELEGGNAALKRKICKNIISYSAAAIKI